MSYAERTKVPVDQSRAEIERLNDEVDRLNRMLKSVAAQCGNVIYNCEQVPADNERHLSSWRGVKEFAEAACTPPASKPAEQKGE